MATQSSIRLIRPLLAVTILTSIFAILPRESHPSEALEGLVYMGPNRAEPGLKSATAFSSDAVDEARWARSQRAYVVGATGEVVPEAAPEGAADAGFAVRFDDASGPKPDAYHFGSHFANEAGLDESRCGPSPATPAEITRLVAEAAQRHNVDAGFAVAVVTAESRLDRLRNSPKGARGPMQLMPATAERFGVTDICDPEQNIDGGIHYLRKLTEEFRNPLLVAAAYNAGEGRVREYGGIPPFEETIRYVAEVLNIQMGLEGSDAAAREQRDVADEQPSSPTSGVITARERRQWVGGVMHF
jgi:soluble lytic murein transglycosylase-like protein